MSGADRFHIVEALKKKGWVEVTDNVLQPPPELLEKAKSMQFYVYDARDLLYLLGDSIDDE